MQDGHTLLRLARVCTRIAIGIGVIALCAWSSAARATDDDAKAPPSKVGDMWTNALDMDFAFIPAGEFMMGSPEKEAGRRDNETQHKVKLTKAYLMQTTEVTRGQWKAVMGTEPWKGKLPELEALGDDHPAVYMSWTDAVAFCAKLSKRDGRTYRLPTEAEWEYAARAGTTTMFSFGDDPAELHRHGNYADRSLSIPKPDRDDAHDDGFDRTAPVGNYQPNRWGLYDMAGNVEEYCSDWMGPYPEGPVVDPTGPAAGTARVRRGGAWPARASFCRSAARFAREPNKGIGHIGLRVVCELEAPEAPDEGGE